VFSALFQYGTIKTTSPSWNVHNFESQGFDNGLFIGYNFTMGKRIRAKFNKLNYLFILPCLLLFPLFLSLFHPAQRSNSQISTLKYPNCISENTKISTPAGPVMIQNLKAGSLIFTFGKMPASIIKVSKVTAVNHEVCRLVFDDGTGLDISPGHALADGRLFGSLRTGDLIAGRRVIKASLVPYKYNFTYDILPDSVSGFYYANGLLVKSTLK
jgi:hypothetical protein